MASLIPRTSGKAIRAMATLSMRIAWGRRTRQIRAIVSVARTTDTSAPRRTAEATTPSRPVFRLGSGTDSTGASAQLGAPGG